MVLNEPVYPFIFSESAVTNLDVAVFGGCQQWWFTLYNQADVLQLLSHIFGTSSFFRIRCNQSLGRLKDDRHGRLLRQTSSTCPPEFQP